MADYYLKTDNIMKNMFTVALKDELAAQSQMGKVRPATEAMLQKVRDYELSEKRLPITTGEAYPCHVCSSGAYYDGRWYPGACSRRSPVSHQ